MKRDWTTTFYAKQTDPENLAEPSACSSRIAYRQVSTPPGAAHLHLDQPNLALG